MDSTLVKSSYQLKPLKGEGCIGSYGREVGVEVNRVIVKSIFS